MKRSIDWVDDICAEMRPTKRLSMLHNTPKQWKEQRRTILKMSKSKLKELGDIESNLRKSVLINNTYRKMRRELKEQCPYSTNVGFAAYSSCEVSNNRLPVPKTHNGYTSMARENIENIDEAAIMYESTTTTTPLCHYDEIPTETDSEVTDDESNQIDISDNKECENSSGENDPKNIDAESDLGLDKDTFRETCAVSAESSLVQDGQGCGMDIDANEPIDYRVKASNLTISTTESNCGAVQSPLAGTMTVDHSHNSPRLCEEAEMDTQIAPGPSQQGLQHNDTSLGQHEKVDPEINSNDQSMANTTAVTQDQSAKYSQDFSLCKYASKPYGFLPNILGPDVIPFSTSSLVSIIASREYHSTQTLSTKSSYLQKNETKDVTTENNSDSKNSDCANNNTSHLFSEGDLQTVEKCTQGSASDSISSSDGLYSPLTCDSDVNQHIWACFQHFNMAVACS